MPNWTKNNISFSGDPENLKKMLTVIIKDGAFDFNTLIPMPKDLEIESGSEVDTGIDLYMTAANPNAPWFKPLSVPEMKREKITKIMNLLYEDNRFHTTNSCTSMKQINSLLSIYSKRRKTSEQETMNGLLNKGQLAVENVLKYGHKDWYSWCRKNWGTKWKCETFATEKVAQ